MSRAFDVLVFDWDGTLADSMADIVRSMTSAIAELGWEPQPDAVLRSTIGLSLSHVCTQLYPDHDGAAVEAFVQAYRRHYLGPAAPRTLLFDQVDSTLHVLAEEGYRLAVATGKARLGLDKVLADTGLAHRFAATRCADETASKPAPDMLEALLWLLDVPAGRALMIGDSEYDLIMARRAGVPAVAVSGGASSDADLLAHEPLGLLPGVHALPGWLSARRR